MCVCLCVKECLYDNVVCVCVCVCKSVCDRCLGVGIYEGKLVCVCVFLCSSARVAAESPADRDLFETHVADVRISCVGYSSTSATVHGSVLDCSITPWYHTTPGLPGYPTAPSRYCLHAYSRTAIDKKNPKIPYDDAESNILIIFPTITALLSIRYQLPSVSPPALGFTNNL